MDKDNGGPAFPESYVGGDVPHEGIGGGMTLRDYFAAAALREPASSVLATQAYIIADAMLEVRKNKLD
jgi:hypothetical protein